jgi:XTP/dITP diphosphohydrolase
MRIVVATQNRGKLRELVELLAQPRLELLTLEDVGLAELDVEETGDTFEANARLKAEAAARLAKLPALADDSGLEVDALGGRPGVWSKRYAGPAASDADNNRKLLAELAGLEPARRGARFRCVLVLAVPEPDGVGARSVLTADGACEGVIATEIRGQGGFGYDPVFVPEGWGESTLGQAAPGEKNRSSHRAAAIRALRPRLLAWLSDPL